MFYTVRESLNASCTNGDIASMANKNDHLLSLLAPLQTRSLLCQTLHFIVSLSLSKTVTFQLIKCSLIFKKVFLGHS